MSTYDLKRAVLILKKPEDQGAVPIPVRLQANEELFAELLKALEAAKVLGNAARDGGQRAVNVTGKHLALTIHQNHLGVLKMTDGEGTDVMPEGVRAIWYDSDEGKLVGRDGEDALVVLVRAVQDLLGRPATRRVTACAPTG